MKIKEYINKSNKYLPKYGVKDFSNHLPMAQYALYKIGASEETISFFTDFYIEKNLKSYENIINTKNINIINKDNFSENLGKNNLYNEFYNYYEKILNSTSLENFIETEFPKLIKGISVGAFHGIIRLGYGIMSENKIEILNAFSYIASNYEILSGERYNNGEELNLEYLNNISEKVKSGEIKIPEKNGIIITYMKNISKDKIFSNIMPNISDNINLEEISEIASKIYANTKNFNALHMVTSAHASRYILRFIKNKENIKDFYYYYIESFLAIYLTMQAPEIKEINYNNNFTFEEIMEKNKKSLNDHNIKLCFTAYEEYNFYKKPIYKYIGNLI